MQRLFARLAVFVVLALLPATARADRFPAWIVEIGSHPGGGSTSAFGNEWTAALAIRQDGSWSSGARHGRLTRDQTTTLRRLAAHARMVSDASDEAACESPPEVTYRMRNWRGVFTWTRPCGAQPDETLTALFERAREFTGVDPSQPSPPPAPQTPPADPNVEQPPPQSNTVIFRFTRENYDRVDGGDQRVVFGDGRWQAFGSAGQLAPDDLRALQAEIAAVHVAMAPPAARHECAARMTGTASVEIPGRGSLQWQEPCGQLDGSLARLLTHVRALTQSQ